MQLILSAGMFLAMLCSVNAAEPLTLRFAFQDADNFPYEVGDGETVQPEKPGLTVEILHIAARKLNLNVEFQRLPWKRCFLELQQGTIDGLFSASFKPERLESGVYPMRDGKVDEQRRLYSTSYVLYTLPGSPIQWDGTKFIQPPKSVGAVRGYSIVDDLARMGIPVVETKNTLSALRNLHAQFFDAVAALELAGDAIIRQQGSALPKVEKVSPPLKTAHYYLMLSHQFVKGHPQLAEDIWNAIGEIRESETFKQRTEEYFRDETTP